MAVVQPLKITGGVISRIPTTDDISIRILRLADGGSQDGYLELDNGVSAAVSAANEGRIRYNATAQTFQVSENTGAWTDLSKGISTPAYGGLSVSGNATATTFSGASSYSQVTVFDTASPSGDVTVSAASDDITINTAGDYLIGFSASLTAGGANNEYQLAVFANNGVTQKNLISSRKVGGTGDVGSAGSGLPVTLAATDTLELWIQNISAGNAVTVQDAQLWVLRVG